MGRLKGRLLSKDECFVLRHIREICRLGRPRLAVPPPGPCESQDDVLPSDGSEQRVAELEPSASALPRA